MLHYQQVIVWLHHVQGGRQVVSRRRGNTQRIYLLLERMLCCSGEELYVSPMRLYAPWLPSLR